jgi:tetratricopeptide (TPR) repeat protein
MLAILTKETVIIAPLIFFVYIWFFVRKIEIYNIVQIFICWFFTFFTWIFLRFLAINNFLYLNKNDIIFSLVKNLPAVFLYFQKIIFPIKLSVLPLLNKKDIWVGVVFFILLIGALILKKEKNIKKIIFGTLWFFLFLIPSFIRPNTTIPADFLEHRIYLSLIGFLIIFSETILFEKIFEKKIYSIFFFIFIFFLSFKTFSHQFNFQNRDIFWQRAVKDSPLSPLAHRNYGVMLYFQRKNNLALKEYQKALELNPEEPMVHNNIGVIFLNQKKLHQAQIEFEKELKINPNYELALTNLGLVFYQLNKLDQAAFYYQKAALINPSPQNYLALVEIYQKKNEPEKAAYFFKLSQLLKSE